MEKADYLLGSIDSCLSAAKKITFGLAAFLLTAVYVVVFSIYSHQDELAILLERQSEIQELLDESIYTLNDIKSYYEGPAEAKQLNFSSFIYALDITEHHLGITLNSARQKTRTPADQAFLDFYGNLIKENVYELRSIMGGLIEQKRKRIPFNQLPISDLLDLDYHKGKDAWQLYYEGSSLRYALYTPDSYGYKKLPDNLDTLEKKYYYYIQDAEKSRRNRTIPKNAGRTESVEKYLDKVAQHNFRSIGQISEELNRLDSMVNEKKKEAIGTVEVPFIDQNINVDSLVWLVPMTISTALLFLLFYILKAKQNILQLNSLDGGGSTIIKSFPWVILPQESRGKTLSMLANLLKYLLLGLPVIVAIVLIANSPSLLSVQSIVGIIFSLISGITIILIIRQVTSIFK